MCGKPEIITAYEKEMGERTVINSMMENATNDGIELGAKQEKIKMVKQMLEKNYDKKDISDITGLTIEAIKEIENQE